jgi:hypothetical protein
MPHPIPEAAPQQHLAILGKTGAGKTFAARAIVDQLGDGGAGHFVERHIAVLAAEDDDRVGTLPAVRRRAQPELDAGVVQDARAAAGVDQALATSEAGFAFPSCPGPRRNYPGLFHSA